MQKQRLGVAPIPSILFVSMFSLVSGNQAYLRVAKAFLFRALTTHKTFAISSLLPRPSSTLNSLPARRYLMFFSKALFWASTDSKPVIFKTSQGAWMLFRGESLLLRIYNSPAQDLHILFLFIYLFKGNETIFWGCVKLRQVGKWAWDLLAMQGAGNPAALVSTWQTSSRPLEAEAEQAFSNFSECSILLSS